MAPTGLPPRFARFADPLVLVLAALVSGLFPGLAAGPDPSGAFRPLILATTTSTQDSGLLDALLPEFEKDSRIGVKTVSVGTGAALALGTRGEADVLLVHAPAAELTWMSEGHGELRLPVMHNEFVVVGPAADPASVSGVATTTSALAQIARTGTRWVSRDDGSGTDLLEKALWKDAGHPELGKAASPALPAWYIRSGQGMGATLMIADARQACTLTDRGTWLAWRKKVRLVELVRGDPRLQNEYHVICVRADKLPAGRIRSREAAAFARWITGTRGQRIIATFGRDRFGEPLFVPASSAPHAPPPGPPAGAR